MQREIFEKLDANGSGYVEKSEFSGVNKFLKSPMAEDELDKMFRQADTLSLGRINALEFGSVLRKTVKVSLIANPTTCLFRLRVTLHHQCR